MSARLEAGFVGACPPRPTFDFALRDEVLSGLLAERKTLPAKLFYDTRGAALFERICELEEYYVTRVEHEILHARAGEIAALLGPRCALIEYGSGAGVKVRLLLDTLEAPVAYVPIDVSRAQLTRVAARLARDYPRVAIRPLCADYTAPLQLPPLPAGARRLAFFPGSTIGNFHPAEAAAFLSRMRNTLGPGGGLVLGVDRRKDVATLHAAYDDREGVTAAFNLNMLARLNRELDADFALDRFRHRAFYATEPGRVEMHLESKLDQDVHIAGVRVHFARRETIWTESSYKYDRAHLCALTAAAGFHMRRLWTDTRKMFWVALLTAS